MCEKSLPSLRGFAELTSFHKYIGGMYSSVVQFEGRSYKSNGKTNTWSLGTSEGTVLIECRAFSKLDLVGRTFERHG